MTQKDFIIYHDGLVDGVGAASAVERRRHERHRVGVFTEIASSSGSPIPGITHNMSHSGMLLLTMEQFAPGQDIEVSFISRDDRREVARGRVVHGTPLRRSALWRQMVGVEFTSKAPRFLSEELG